ncbi:IS200/IS605 family transposase [Brucella haematophila]|uniref:IS200/IS605 family transposase n=1 Tax=Brucella haematophila TaxID=419474 RepID=A0ABX1DJG6_9HYPH|nr:IS200/IS605 family transposase [Brucella haematophila]NKC03103.1 IS200/IS605 family transposase [Brucella haematophila]TMU95777.1 IS200/IS605 family transposase [Brucella haematophila]
MRKYSTTNPTWVCQYHVAFGSKYRTKRLYGGLHLELWALFIRLSLQKGCRIEEGHLMPDHVHILISIPPKYSVAHIVGFLKGKTALYVANEYAKKRKYRGYHFWARGYFVSTTGYDEQVVRRYIRNQEKAGKDSDQADLFKGAY